MRHEISGSHSSRMVGNNCKDISILGNCNQAWLPRGLDISNLPTVPVLMVFCPTPPIAGDGWLPQRTLDAAVHA